MKSPTKAIRYVLETGDYVDTVKDILAEVRNNPMILQYIIATMDQPRSTASLSILSIGVMIGIELMTPE